MFRYSQRLICSTRLAYIRCLSASCDILPKHIKFRMPDLNIEQISSSTGGAKLSKWLVIEGQKIEDGIQMCEIETPDLIFGLESGDKGYVAKLVVPEGSDNIPPGQTLAVLVPDPSDITPFQDALQRSPQAIEGYKERSDGHCNMVVSHESNDGAEILRILRILYKKGNIKEESFKVLKSLARKNDEQLLVTYKGSFIINNDNKRSAFDEDFFLENVLELAEEELLNSGKK